MKTHTPAPPALLRPVATLLSGSGAAFLIGYAAKPLLLRLFPVAAFGAYDFVIALVAVGIPVASLRYEDAIVLPEDDREARDVLILSMLLTVAAALLAAGAVWLLGYLVQEPDTRLWLWTAPVLLLVLRVSKLSELWLTRKRAFPRISAGSTLNATVSTGSKLAMGASWLGPGLSGTGGLLLGFGLGHVSAAGLYLYKLARTWPSGGRVNLLAAARRYHRFALFASPAALVSALATRLPFILLMTLYGAEVLGWFGQAFNVLYVPLSLVGAAVGQVFFVTAAEAHRSDTLRPATVQVHRMLAATSIVPLAGVCAAAPEIFAFVFGEPWRPAGQYALYIAPWIALTAIGSPLTRIFDVLEMQRRDLVVNAGMFALVATALLFASEQSDPSIGILALGVAGVAGRVLQIVVALHAAGLSLAAAIQPYLVPTLVGIALFGLVHFAAMIAGGAGATAALFIGLLVWIPTTYRRLR